MRWFRSNPVYELDRLVERDRALAKTISRNLDDTTPRRNRANSTSPTMYNVVCTCGWVLAFVVVSLTVALMAANKGT